MQDYNKKSFSYQTKLLSVNKAFVQLEEDKEREGEEDVNDETEETEGGRERERKGDSCTDIYTATKSCGMLQVADPRPASEELVLPARPLHSRPEWFYHLKREKNKEWTVSSSLSQK